MWLKKYCVTVYIFHFVSPVQAQLTAGSFYFALCSISSSKNSPSGATE